MSIFHHAKSERKKQVKVSCIKMWKEVKLHGKISPLSEQVEPVLSHETLAPLKYNKEEFL